MTQKHVLVYWEAGATNGGDYFTKNLPPSYHIQVRLILDIAAARSNL